MSFGSIDSMWVIVTFDLPTTIPNERRQYSKFRNFLMDDGFTMMQYSVYMHHSVSVENAVVHIQRVKSRLPTDGELRIIKKRTNSLEKVKFFW